VCDNGGWTDTWFAGSGAVCNLGVTPGVTVRVDVRPGSGAVSVPGDDALLLACVEEAAGGLAAGADVRVSVDAAVPPGASTGTSASVAVALLGALDALAGGARRPAVEVAAAAHRVEVERLGLQSGVQDQLCAAVGGLCFIDIARYPEASVVRVPAPPAFLDEVGRRLLLVYLGRPHRSSEVHDRVIARLGADVAPLAPLRALAARARDAALAGDVGAWARSLSENTAAQAALHPDLVGPEASAVIDVARAFGALGWKVDGAGGEGGSVTLVSGDDRRLAEAVASVDPSFRVIPVQPSTHGLVVTLSGDAQEPASSP
jgi:D-glycero-alpha-D-manno-heptose-7-phosphate kinase